MEGMFDGLDAMFLEVYELGVGIVMSGQFAKVARV